MLQVAPEAGAQYRGPRPQGGRGPEFERPGYSGGPRTGQGARTLPRLRDRRLLCYLCLKLGLRFSMKAAMPSFWSSRAKSEWNRRRSNRTPSARVVS